MHICIGALDDLSQASSCCLLSRKPIFQLLLSSRFNVIRHIFQVIIIENESTEGNVFKYMADKCQMYLFFHTIWTSCSCGFCGFIFSFKWIVSPIYPRPLELFHWHLGNGMVVPLLGMQPWRMWVKSTNVRSQQDGTKHEPGIFRVVQNAYNLAYYLPIQSVFF